MFVRQISVFAENRSGAILEITSVLKETNINIRALSIADTADFGVVRLIVSDTDKALAALRERGLTAMENPVMAIRIDDTPGAFHGILEALYEKTITIEYSYAYASPTAGATVIMKCRRQELAAQLIQAHGYKLLSQEEADK
ncbi:MAG: ACT domain-containing protein [Oscillospiraceae bacterium]